MFDIDIVISRLTADFWFTMILFDCISVWVWLLARMVVMEMEAVGGGFAEKGEGACIAVLEEREGLRGFSHHSLVGAFLIPCSPFSPRFFSLSSLLLFTAS